MRAIGIEYGEMQGLMMADESGHTTRLAPDFGQPLVYVDYVEAAPWNVRRANPIPRFQNVGLHLVRAAVILSRRLGFAGRVGLHSLPQLLC